MADSIPFETDDQIAAQLRSIAVQLERWSNGLDNLEALLPTLAREPRLQARRLAELAAVLDPQQAAA